MGGGRGEEGRKFIKNEEQQKEMLSLPLFLFSQRHLLCCFPPPSPFPLRPSLPFPPLPSPSSSFVNQIPGGAKFLLVVAMNDAGTGDVAFIEIDDQIIAETVRQVKS